MIFQYTHGRQFFLKTVVIIKEHNAFRSCEEHFYHEWHWQLRLQRRKDKKLQSIQTVMMLARSGVFLLSCLLSTSALSMTLYNNALFKPFASGYQLAAPFLANSQTDCACQCHSDRTCITCLFFSHNQTCILFSAYLSQGRLELTPSLTSVISFSNKTISDGE